AAPVFVPGAITAKSAASRMKKPAEAARTPLGPTKTITGTLLLKIFSIICRIDVSRPPGVLNRRMTAADCSNSACAIPWTTYSAVIGCTTSSSSSFRMPAVARLLQASSRNNNKQSLLKAYPPLPKCLWLPDFQVPTPKSGVPAAQPPGHGAKPGTTAKAANGRRCLPSTTGQNATRESRVPCHHGLPKPGPSEYGLSPTMVHVESL